MVDESHVRFIDVQTEQTQATGRAAADTIKKLQRLMNQVVICLAVVLFANVILNENKREGQNIRNLSVRTGVLINTQATQAQD